MYMMFQYVFQKGLCILSTILKGLKSSLDLSVNDIWCFFLQYKNEHYGQNDRTHHFRHLRDERVPEDVST